MPLASSLPARMDELTWKYYREADLDARQLDLLVR
jgi:hypothetical protein